MNFYVLIGNPLGHSLSPRIHALISEVTGVPCEYALMPLETGAVEPFLRSLAEGGIDGVNVTIPHKVLAAQSVDALSPEARSLGAINTIRPTPRGTVGHNTDLHGFQAMLDAAGIAPEGQRCAVLGAGGSARAVTAVLRQRHAAEIFVVSRQPEAVTTPFPGAQLIDYDKLRGMDGGLLVNCTPVGMSPRVEGCPVDGAVVARFGAVADLIYNPKETVLLRMSAERGLPRANGLLMLVAQAVRAREIWEDARYGTAVERAVHDRLAAEWEANP